MPSHNTPLRINLSYALSKLPELLPQLLWHQA